ncbi:YeeE/YedE family protein [Mesorhizobium sp. M8A.F.Ca.ET.059.01.1.1]|nr:YeeE/YedE family protein [Mesorhizobium sp. M8A.F.Ca.ET.059.01.1.1]
MNRLVSAFLIGGIFGLGIAVSGMINPAKVLNFFDIAGTWDPSLIFVMGGGLAVAFIGYRLVFGRCKAPVFETEFALPTKRVIDLELVGGAAVFGIGWGIAGFCPGGAIPALGLGYSQTPIFVASVIAGIVVARFARARIAQPATA